MLVGRAALAPIRRRTQPPAVSAIADQAIDVGGSTGAQTLGSSDLYEDPPRPCISRSSRDQESTSASLDEA